MNRCKDCKHFERLDAIVSSNVLDVNYPEVREAIQKRITSFIEAAIEEVEGLKGKLSYKTLKKLNPEFFI